MDRPARAPRPVYSENEGLSAEDVLAGTERDQLRAVVPLDNALGGGRSVLDGPRARRLFGHHAT